MHALSLKQPWAALLVTGRKTIEIRRWATELRGPVLIHAARVPDPRPEAWGWVDDALRPLTEMAGGVIGIAEIAGCRTYPEARAFLADRGSHLNEAGWFSPPMYGFEFVNPRQLPFRRCKGQVRLFRIDGGQRPEVVLPPEACR